MPHPATAATEATLYIVKLAGSPLLYSATTTVFGYLTLAAALRQAERFSEWSRPKQEVWAVRVAAIEATDDECVGMAPGASVQGIELRKRINGGAA